MCSCSSYHSVNIAKTFWLWYDGRWRSRDYQRKLCFCASSTTDQHGEAQKYLFTYHHHDVPQHCMFYLTACSPKHKPVYFLRFKRRDKRALHLLHITFTANLPEGDWSSSRVSFQSQTCLCFIGIYFFYSSENLRKKPSDIYSDI